MLIEREDFASGTSSKSTKLVHGGVRYLEKAVFNLDYDQFKLVREALQERRSLLDNAGHLTSALPILMPCYKWWEVPFYWSGLKAYDLIAGFKNLAASKYLTPSESQRRLPTLADSNEDGRSLKGSVRQLQQHSGQSQLPYSPRSASTSAVIPYAYAPQLSPAPAQRSHTKSHKCLAVSLYVCAWSAAAQILYYDGQFDDARLNVALATTAAAAGATVLNYTAAETLLKVCCVMGASRGRGCLPDGCCRITVDLADAGCRQHLIVHGMLAAGVLLLMPAT